MGAELAINTRKHDDHAQRLDGIDALGQHVAPQTVDHHVNALAAGPFLNTVNEIVLARVDGQLSPHLLGQCHIGVVTDRGGDFGTHGLRHLDLYAASTAGPAMDQHFVAGPDLAHLLDRPHAGRQRHGEGCGVLGRETGVILDHPLRRDLDVLRIGARNPQAR